MDKKVLEELTEIVGAQAVLTEPLETERYSHDEMSAIIFSAKRFMPAVVVKPKSTEEVSKILMLASRENLPVTPRGGGTGLCGGCVPVSGGIVLSLERMSRVIEVDRANLMGVFEAGVPLGRIYEEAERAGLSFPPHPGDESAQIGGLIATSAGGARTVKYGTIRNYVRGLEIVLADGRIINVGGKFVKSSTGYNLVNLFIGSEGTLGVMTKAIISLLPKPAASTTLIVPFEKLDGAIKAVPEILAKGIIPVALEFMEEDIIYLAEKKLEKRWPSPKGASYLMIMLDADSHEQLDRLSEQIASLCEKTGCLDVFVADSKTKQKEILDFRSNFHEIFKPDKMLEDLDIVVPRSKTVELVDFLHRLETKFGIWLLTYGHAGDGNLHVHIMRTQWTKNEGCGMKDREIDIDKVKEAKKEIFEKTKELGGTLTGEHGIGYLKVRDLPDFVGERQIELMRAIKKAFDPKGILNPRKIIE